MKFAKIDKWKAAIVIVFATLLAAEVGILIRQERTQMVARQARTTAAQLIDFSKARAQLMDRRPDESIGEYQERISALNLETQALYEKQFYETVVDLRREFKGRGIEDGELEEFCAKPVYPVAIREVGEGLYRLADRIE